MINDQPKKMKPCSWLTRLPGRSTGWRRIAGGPRSCYPRPSLRDVLLRWRLPGQLGDVCWDRMAADGGARWSRASQPQRLQRPLGSARRLYGLTSAEGLAPEKAKGCSKEFAALKVIAASRAPRRGRAAGIRLLDATSLYGERWSSPEGRKTGLKNAGPVFAPHQGRRP